MKILGISFGTKNGNNDTMCKVALKGAQEAGAEVEFIQMSSLNIKHCTGCCACVKTLLSGKGSMCVLKDDFEWLLDKMKDADGIVVSDPIFEEGASGLFHTIMDRFGPRADRGNNIIGTKVAEATGGKVPDSRMLNDKVISFMGIGGSDWGTRVQCEHAMLALIPMWKIIDNAWLPWAKELVMDDSKLAQVHQIGLNIVEAAENFDKALYKGEEGVCPHCNNRLFYLEPGTKKSICALCGIVGELDTVNGKTVFSFPEEQLGHAHDTLAGKFIHGDDIKQMEGHYAEVCKTPEFKERKAAYNFIEPATKEKHVELSLGE